MTQTTASQSSSQRWSWSSWCWCSWRSQSLCQSQVGLEAQAIAEVPIDQAQPTWAAACGLSMDIHFASQIPADSPCPSSSLHTFELSHLGIKGIRILIHLPHCHWLRATPRTRKAVIPSTSRLLYSRQSGFWQPENNPPTKMWVLNIESQVDVHKIIRGSGWKTNSLCYNMLVCILNIIISSNIFNSFWVFVPALCCYRNDGTML